MTVERRTAFESKDFWSGTIFLLAGIGFVIFGRNHPMGTAVRMGPAYFPTILGGLLALIGLAVIVRAILRPGPPVGSLAYGKIAMVIGSCVLFAVLLRPLGLAATVVLLVLVSARASDRFRWPAALALAAGMAAGSCVVFVRLLGLPIPILGRWLGGW